MTTSRRSFFASGLALVALPSIFLRRDRLTAVVAQPRDQLPEQLYQAFDIAACPCCGARHWHLSPACVLIRHDLSLQSIAFVCPTKGYKFIVQKEHVALSRVASTWSGIDNGPPRA